jgi:antirestriction protein ArdC
MATQRDIYQEVTDRILELLDQGTVPWRQPIRRTAHGDGFPKSISTKRRYRGINVFLLAATAWAKGYESSYWYTFHQAKACGGQVRKGERSTLVVFWKQYATQDRETGEEINVPVLRHYNVFNAAQIEGVVPPDGIPPAEPTPPFEPLAEAEQIVAGYQSPPAIEHVGNRACYLPLADRIEIAPPERFVDREGYYVTLFHELVHSTGHASRLHRDIGRQLSPFGSPDYSKEELVAELGAAFLAAAAGISPPTIEQSAAYIDGWRKKLADDKKLVVQAAGLAQRAADRILGVTFAEADAEDAEHSPAAAPAPVP